MGKDKVLFPQDYGQIIKECEEVFNSDVITYLESQLEAHRGTNPNYLNNLLCACQDAMNAPFMLKMKQTIALNDGGVSYPPLETLQLIENWINLKLTEVKLNHIKHKLIEYNNLLKDIETDFNSMFKVDPQPTMYIEGESLTSIFDFTKEHPFNISNRQTVQAGGTVKDAHISKYLAEVTFMLTDHLKPSEIPAFLSYHYTKASNKQGLINLLKYDIWEMIPDIKPQRKGIIEQWINNIETTEQGHQSEAEDIDTILRRIFPNILEFDLKTLKGNLLNGGRAYISLTYKGTLIKLWRCLGKLCQEGVDRGEICRVFSTYVYWQKSVTSEPEKIEYLEINKRIIIKG